MKTHPLSREALLHLFNAPPPQYGDFVTWFWEAGQLGKEQLTWQLEELKKKGVAGTWFYPRYLNGEPYGTYPAYFTDGWWDFFKHSVSEHRRLGLEAWFAGWEGRGHWRELLRKDRQTIPELMGRRLVTHNVETDGRGRVQLDIPGAEEILSAAAYHLIHRVLDATSRQDLSGFMKGHRLAWEAPGAGWLVTVVTSQPHDLNYLDPAVADRWIEIYWKVHEEKLREFIGNTLTLYGQDEMFVLDGNILYSPVLQERFQAEKGYDPRPHLVGLFCDIGDFTDKIRCDYYELMSAMIEESFYSRLSQWHHERGMKFGTIATWGRQDLLGQTWHYGDYFRLMRWFDVTGNEDPMASEPGERCFIDAKLSSSVLHIYERDRAGMCVYWMSGWGMTQEQNLAWTNENYAYGLNLYNQHGGLYSTLGGWYQWVPPSIHWRQPYWEHWKTFVEYVSRLSAVLSQGVHRADVALLYPLTTIHANWLKGDHFTMAADEAATETFALAEYIYRSGIDFDFVDDHTLSRAQVSGGKLKVAGIEFPVVVLPPMTTIRTETLEKLKAFYEGGGTVVAFRRLPSASQECGRNDPKIRSLLEGIFGIASSAEYVHATEAHRQARGSIRKQENARGGKAFFVPIHEVHGAPHRHGPGRGTRVQDVITEAITPDVVVSGKSVFHTHQRIGDLDAYFIYNVRPERRKLRFTFAVCGEPEIWDAHSGHVIPVYSFAHQGERTSVRLTMERNQGILLIFTPCKGRPAAVEGNMDITGVEPTEDGLAVQGTCDTGGRKWARILYQGQEYAAETRLSVPPTPLALDGDWGFELLPTMDNRWGDFRHPASTGCIGAEARQFKYMEEGERAGSELGWHRPEYDDGHWTSFTYSFGPYWLTIGPFTAGQEPVELVKRAIAGEVDPDRTHDETGKPCRWERYTFSQRFGRARTGAPSIWAMGEEGVPDEFIFFGGIDDDCDATRYLFTSVHAPKESDWDLHIGASEGEVRQAWLNGAEVCVPVPCESGGRSGVRVHLRQGLNTVLLALIHRQRKPIKAFAALQDPSRDIPLGGPPVPRLRWFAEPTDLIYDIKPEGAKRAGWYRFEAPAGTQAMRMVFDAESVQAWVNGEPVDADAGVIKLSVPVEGVAQVALRIVQKPGVYGGAAIPEPVAFQCAPTRMPLGDWCAYALESYSGGAVYSKTFELQAYHLGGRVILDLGMANSTAEVVVNGHTVGVGLGRPYRFDITEYVQEGENQLRVTVFNTLANHYGQGPLSSSFVFEGQTLSGLIGPVTIQFLAKPSLVARPVLA